MFYHKTIIISRDGEKYKDEYGITHYSTETVYKTTKADVQPYSRELLKKEYGYDIECTKRVFMALDNTISDKWYITYESVKYTIVKIIKWDTYMELVLNDNI